MKRSIVNTAGHVNDHRAILTAALLFGSVLCAAFYAFNLYTLISHTVALRQIDSQMVAIGSELSSLDSEYLKLASAITPDAVTAHGLMPAQVSVYITRPQPTASIGNLAQGGHEL